MPTNADALELYMLELINEERTSRGLNAFLLEANLNASAEAHSQWMLQTDTFSHTGAGNSTATQRIDAEFDLSGSWRTAENIAIQSERGSSDLFDDVEDLHTSLMNSEGHRANLLNPDLVYIGIGIEFDDFTYSSGSEFPSVIVTQNFASTQGSVDLDPGTGEQSTDTGPEFTDGNDDITLNEAGTFFALGGDDIVSGTASADVINGGLGEDRLHGNAGNDTLNGDEGEDRLYDGAGNDFVQAGSGNDFVRVGGGVDILHGGAGKDYISYYGSPNGVKINLETNEVSGSRAHDDTISGFESVSGSRTGDDIIFGTSGSNTIKTFGGNDRVYAGSGADNVQLGDGNDFVRVGGGQESFDGGSGTDYISYYNSTGGVSVDLKTDTVSGSWASDDTISNFESASGSKTGDDKLYGTAGANRLKAFGGDDKLYGRSGDDKLYGGDGEDRFDGGTGTDLLYGGADADVFHFDHGEDHDIIKDFENNIDTIQLDNFTFEEGQNAFDFVTKVGSDVVFDFGDGDMLTVENATIGQLYNDLVVV